MKTTYAYIHLLTALLISIYTASSISVHANEHERNGLFRKSFSKQKKHIHKKLEKKYGYIHISQLGITKSDVHKSKYYVEFTDDGHIYNAYYSRWGRISRLKKVADLHS